MKYSKSRKYMGKTSRVKGHKRKVYVRRKKKWNLNLSLRVSLIFLDLIKNLQRKNNVSWRSRKVY